MITLYTYQCRDNVVRTRCHRHMARYGPQAINQRHEIRLVERSQPDHRCIECFYEWMDAKIAHGDMTDDHES